MKRKLKGVLGVALTLILVVTFALGMAAPVAAQDYKENDWGEWGLPSLKADTDIGPMAVAPDGTLYAAIYFTSTTPPTQRWKVAMSDDNGYSWSDTEFDDIDASDIGAVVSVVISQNYEDDELVYVGTYGGNDDPTVYRMEEAGEGDLVALKDFPGDNVSSVYCIDVFYDEGKDACWIMAATEDDVYVLLDELFENWRPQELDDWESPIIDKGYGEGDETYGFGDALEVAFAPDFDDSDLIWAIISDNDTTDGPHFWITATVSPGQWGQDVGDGWFDLYPSPWLDMDFPDDYDSEDEIIVYAGLSNGSDNGGVWLIEGVDADDGFSNTIDLFYLSDDVTSPPLDIVSIAVSGDYGDEVILAGAMWAPEIYISDDGGMNWDDVSKPPTGDAWTHVYMEADVVWGGEVFDPDEGMAFASTWGTESAVSRADDGGEVYNQVGYIDTAIKLVSDLAFHPDFPETPTYLMSTYSDLTSKGGTTSLWLTENGDEDEPDYVRLLCGDPAGAPGNFSGWFGLVTYSWDADAIYITGTDSIATSGTVPGPEQSVIWKSTNDGQTFGSKRAVEDDAFIRDWEITDDRTIYAACWDFGNTEGGFYMSTNSGLSWSSDETGTNFNDIAMSPDFEDGEGYILLGGMDGEIMLSDNDGDSFDDAEDEEESGLASDGIVYVAFDADFADEDADGYMYIYAADDQGSAIQEGEVADTDDVDWDKLKDNKGDDDPQDIYATGLVVAEDNALYAIGTLAEVEEETIEVIVDGVLDIVGETSDDSGNVDVLHEVRVTDGDFRDEDVSVDSESLTIDVDGTDVTVSGRVWISGDDSGAEGYFTLSAATVYNLAGTSPYFDDGEEVYIEMPIGGYNLETTIEVTVVTVESGLVRLLLHESNNLWESQDDTNLEDPFHLWVTPGTNVLWTIDMDGYGGDAEIWALEDTCSGQVTLSAPSDGYKSDREDQMRISWNEVRDADEYEYKYTNVEPDYTLKGQTDEISILLTRIDSSSEYEWKVRVAPDEPWHSRWSGKWSFFTALGEPPWTPTLYTPGGVWQYSGVDVELMPAFSWESAQSADSYQFVLADNAKFTSPLVNEKVPESAFNLDFELELNKNYFWKVMAYKGAEALSRWSDIGAFTTVGPAPPAPPPPVTVAPPAPPPAPIVLPTPIPPFLLWTIIGIGAALVIAVIVLIVRTRRAV